VTLFGESTNGGYHAVLPVVD